MLFRNVSLSGERFKRSKIRSAPSVGLPLPLDDCCWKSANMRRRSHTCRSVSALCNSSSCRVPLRSIATAGQMRRSAMLRSRCNSILPVPLNSSYIRSSKRLPVSISAVATMVRLPPSSQFRAAPKNCLGGYSASGSMPPDSVLPLLGILTLNARASLVRLSRTSSTSSPDSTRRLARSSARSDVSHWCSTCSSNVEE